MGSAELIVSLLEMSLFANTSIELAPPKKIKFHSFAIILVSEGKISELVINYPQFVFIDKFSEIAAKLVEIINIKTIVIIKSK